MVGGFAFFMMLFLLVVKFLPSVAMNEVKEHIMLDHPDHAAVVAGIEPHELPHA